MMTKQCAEMMTKNPVCCSPEDTAERAATLMKSHDIGSVPVVEAQDSRTIVGVVTDRDLALKVVAESRDPGNTRVGDLMTREVVTCRGEDDVKVALAAMKQHQVRRVMITDKNNRLVGVIAQADVATGLPEPERVAGVVKEISKSARLP